MYTSAARVMSVLVLFLLFSCGHQAPKAEFTYDTATENTASTNSVDGVFDIPELSVSPSPTQACRLNMPMGDKLVDYDVSPAGSTVAIITSNSSGSQLQLWNLGDSTPSDFCKLPNGFLCKAICWHPLAKSVFVMGENAGEYQILRLEKTSDKWTTSSIFKSKAGLRRLVACPRPFITGYNTKANTSFYEYRLFFGMDNGDKSYRIVSITEFGNRFYQVIGPKKTQTSPEKMESELPPSEITADWALPLAFHPAGHELIWEDKNSKFNTACYASIAWGKSKPFAIPVAGGTITPTPNGIGILHWQKGISGIGVCLLPYQKEETQLANYQFISTPSSVPDGKGIVGLTRENNCYQLNYIPISVPLADVLNAWMYIKTPTELQHFSSDYGLFRPNNCDQLYKLYETENYYCESYDRSSPTRPYLVTTDIFWELFGSAYQGLFIVKERDQAIPSFWQFIDKANSWYSTKNSKWTTTFAVLSEFKKGTNPTRPEIKHINECSNAVSEVTGEEYSFFNLKPRGHYSSNREMAQYFKAFKYLTTILEKDKNALSELSKLPDDISQLANNWIKSYSGFIAPSRSPAVWASNQSAIPAYCQYPSGDASIFPLSWGFDNEVLNSAVYHQNYPKKWQVTGAEGPRITPSGLDLASVLGNRFAEDLLKADFEKYPPLRKVIDNLKSIYAENKGQPVFKDNLYNQWLNAMAVQWADTVRSSNGMNDQNLWQAKRLQTGLATWATLRHATVLVNEKGAAECGEGGFEEILMRAPRGAVEPDPYTFTAIAQLFETAVDYVSKTIDKQKDISESYEENNRSLYNGITTRLKEAAQQAREFAEMARKEPAGIALSNEENEKILYVSRVGEHLFLIFNSLSNPDYALSDPDPMPKIADVYGDGIISPHLMVAVGNTSEWDYIVPFYGRHQIVKGGVYAYYEFKSNDLLNDEEWRKQVNQQKFASWLQPYICNDLADGMAETGY